MERKGFFLAISTNEAFLRNAFLSFRPIRTSGW